MIVSPRLPQEAAPNEVNSGLETGSPGLHRQVDAQDFVFAEREAVSPWSVAPPSRLRLPAHADQNSSHSGIHRINRQTGDEIESSCCRVFLDPAGKDAHPATQRHVPLGETTSHEIDGRGAPPRNARHTVSEVCKPQASKNSFQCEGKRSMKSLTISENEGETYGNEQR